MALGVTRMLEAIRIFDKSIKFYRPAEVELLLGDCGKAREKHGWQPECDFDELVCMMVDANLDRLSHESALEK